MKTLKALLAVGLLFAVALGCTTTKSKENMLSAAGFKMVPANTPERQAHLKSLPADKVTAVQRQGTTYYTFPDRKNNVLYVGQEQQYQKYRQLRFEQNLADEQLETAQMNENAWGAWGAWGPGFAWY